MPQHSNTDEYKMIFLIDETTDKVETTHKNRQAGRQMYSSPRHCWNSTQGRQTDGQTEAESIAMTHNALVPGTNIFVIVVAVH